MSELLGLGRITRGEIVTGDQVTVVSSDGAVRKGKILQVMGYKGLERAPV